MLKEKHQSFVNLLVSFGCVARPYILPVSTVTGWFLSCRHNSAISLPSKYCLCPNAAQLLRSNGAWCIQHGGAAGIRAILCCFSGSSARKYLSFFLHLGIFFLVGREKFLFCIDRWRLSDANKISASIFLEFCRYQLGWTLLKCQKRSLELSDAEFWYLWRWCMIFNCQTPFPILFFSHGCFFPITFFSAFDFESIADKSTGMASTSQ